MATKTKKAVKEKMSPIWFLKHFRKRKSTRSTPQLLILKPSDPQTDL